MNTNSKQSTGRTHSGAVCRIIGVLFGLFTFIWLSTPEVAAALQLISPPNCKTPNNLDLCDETDGVTVFRWTQSEDPRVDSYRVIFSENPDFTDPLFQDGITPELPGPGDKKIVAPQAFLDLRNGPFVSFEPYFWRVVALDESGRVVEQSQETYAFFYEQDGSGFTVITGLVKSDFNQAALVGARVAVSSPEHTVTTDATNSIAETIFNGVYIVIALTTDSIGDPIDFPIEVTYTKEGFQTIVADDLQKTEKVNGVITRDLVMESTADFDGDGILDVVENASCLNTNDVDTDDDGIADGDEDKNKDGVKNAGETDPCRLDTDNDLIQDGTELGLTLNDIGPDTDTNMFQPDIDPTTTTNPLDADTDDDGIADGDEDKNHNGRVDAGETDPNPSNLSTLRAQPHIPLLLLSD